MAGPDRKSLEKNPNLDLFRRKKLEVLFISDPIDSKPGALVFKLMGKTYRIDPIWDMSDPEPRNLFIIFKDQTSGKETYGAARYMYANRPDANGNTVADFNKSYNPPCVFTHFATCPLPPPQNRLPIRIEAGEKKYTGHV